MTEKSFFKSSIFYLVVSLINGLIVILTTTLVANNLTSSQLGSIDILINTSNIFITIIHFGSTTFIAQKKAVGIVEDKKIYNLGFNLIFYNSILLLIFSSFLVTKISIYEWVFLIIYSIFLSIISFYLSHCQIKNEKIKYSLITITISLLNFLLLYSLKSTFDFYFLRLYCLIFVYFIIVIYVFYKEKSYLKRFTPKINFKNYKEALRFGKHLFYGSVSSILNERFDRFYVFFILGSSLNGYYSTMYQFGSIMLIVQSAVSRAWLPVLRNKSYLELKKTIKKVNISLIVISLFVSIFSIFYTKYFLPTEFFNYWPIILIISLSYGIDGILKIYNGFLIINKDYKYFKNLNIIGAVTSIIFTVLLSHNLSIYGPAIATLLSFIIPLILILKKKTVLNE